MTRGKWIILGLLIILAAIVTQMIREKRAEIGSELASLSIEEPVPEIEKPTSVIIEEVAAVFPEDGDQPGEMNGHNLQVIVQDESGQPLPDARVRTKIQAEKSRIALTNFNADLTTDANGIARVLWPLESFKQLELSVSKTNYSSRKMTWDFETGDSIPPSYTIKLKEGFRIGGLVVDPEDNPVSGATISISRFWSGDDDGPKRKGEQPSFSSQKQTTGADGRWSAHDLPLELIDRISVQAKHTDFMGAQASIRDPQTEKELRDETHKLVLKRGLEVYGRVLDEQGKPIIGAKVWAGRKFTRERQETKSDDEGGFAFRNINEGETLFSVMAEGYEADSRSQMVSTASPEIIFRLSKGAVIAGKVVSKDGEPIEGVRVVLEGNFGDPGYDHYEFSKMTDKEGKFEWTSAPNQPMPFYIAKSGYQQKRGVRLKPGEENVVRLLRNRQVQGQVLNAETGQPVTQFRIAIGRKTGDRFDSDSYDAKEFTSATGLFTIDIREENQNGIQATANEFAEQIQRLPAKGEESAQVIFKLKPSSALEGIVMTPNGRPVSGASVALLEGASTGMAVRFANGRMRSSGSQSKLVTTDSEGRFSIPSPPETGKIAASGEEGFAFASLAEVRASGGLTLQIFGRIEGVLLRGSSGAEGEELMLSSPGGGIYFDFDGYKSTSDLNGLFTFEKVPAGAWSIVRLVKSSPRSWMHSHSTPVTVAAGQTTHITLGGVDATLQGHVSFEVDPAEPDLIITGNLSTAGPQLPPGLTQEEMRALFASPEWKEQMKLRKHYSVLIDKNGSFVLDSVVPGEYTLSIRARKASDQPFNAKSVAQGETKVTVPVGSNPSSPINVGEIVIRPFSVTPAPQVWDPPR